MANWPITLVGMGYNEDPRNTDDGYGNATGDVITGDGEFLGTWSMLNGAIYSFIPDGEEDSIFSDTIIPMFCDQIEKWHKEQSS